MSNEQFETSNLEFNGVSTEQNQETAYSQRSSTVGSNTTQSDRHEHSLGNCMGNLGVFQRNLYPYLWKPVPVGTGMGFVWVQVWVLYLNMYILI